VKRKVLYARLGSSPQISGSGDIATILPPSTRQLKNLEMWFDGQNLSVKFLNYEGTQNIELLIPSGNIASLRLDPSDGA